MKTPDHKARGASPHPGLSPVPKLNLEDYREDLAGFYLSQEQEEELIQALWMIVCTLIDIGFGFDAVQQVIPDYLQRAFDAQSSHGSKFEEEGQNTL